MLQEEVVPRKSATYKCYCKAVVFVVKGIRGDVEEVFEMELMSSVVVVVKRNEREIHKMEAAGGPLQTTVQYLSEERGQFIFMNIPVDSSKAMLLPSSGQVNGCRVLCC